MITAKPVASSQDLAQLVGVSHLLLTGTQMTIAVACDLPQRLWLNSLFSPIAVQRFPDERLAD
jgi:hypothetical protein